MRIEELRAVAKANGISGVELARRYGVSKRLAQYWLSGHRTRPADLESTLSDLIEERKYQRGSARQ